MGRIDSYTPRQPTEIPHDKHTTPSNGGVRPDVYVVANPSRLASIQKDKVVDDNMTSRPDSLRPDDLGLGIDLYVVAAFSNRFSSSMVSMRSVFQISERSATRTSEKLAKILRSSCTPSSSTSPVRNTAA